MVGKRLEELYGLSVTFGIFYSNNSDLETRKPELRLKLTETPLSP